MDMFYETEELERYIEEHGLRAAWEKGHSEPSRSKNEALEMLAFINGALGAINAIHYLLEEKLEDGDEDAYGATMRLILRLKIQAGEMMTAARM
jgi:hypothetical protein